ncbi:unnamed protein product [Durusdinium trenchii]|uniref:Peptide-N-glycosidase F N-terminal domain-containing protein n=2 Tax=Durusdinium trenchii TaxID=1381693 RepID=A0ABP0IVW4_9DINO
MAEDGQGAFPSQYDESGMTSFDRVEAELRGEQLKLICDLSIGSRVEVVCNVGHDVAYAKGQVSRQTDIEYGRLQFFLDDKLMFDPLSFNDFPAIMASPTKEVLVRVEVPAVDGYYSFGGPSDTARSPRRVVIKLYDYIFNEVMRREKLQSELASRTGNFFLLLMQQVHKKLRPGRPLPKTEEELESVSLLEYLEKSGGYRNQRSLGLVQWIVAHGCGRSKRHGWVSRPLGSASNGCRTGKLRQWRLVRRLPDQSTRGASGHHVSRENNGYHFYEPAFLAPHSSCLDGDDSGVSQRFGGALEQEARFQETGYSKDSDRDRVRESTISKEEAQIPSTAKGPSGRGAAAVTYGEPCMEGQTAETAFEGRDPVRIHEEHHLFGVPAIGECDVEPGDNALFASSKAYLDFQCREAQAKDRKAPAEESKAALCFGSSKAVYGRYDILGSPQKDVVGEVRSKVIGAEINSGPSAATQGVATCGAPIAKRLALSVTSLQLAQLAYTSDALHLCLLGAWTSIMLYRRPLMGIFSAAHGVVQADEVDSAHPRLVPLSRKVANEFVIASVLAPLAVSDLAARFEDKIYSTDASDSRGAITSAPLDPVHVGHLWRACKSKGAYSRLKTPLEMVLLRLGVSEEGIEEDDCSGDLAYGKPSLERPLAFEYDFIEVYAGSARVSEAAMQLGLVVGPPIDISYSGELDLCLPRVLEWITYMLANYQLKSVMVEPVCTSFSLMRRPPLRSKEVPYGFDLGCPQTRVGNQLALRALAILSLCHRLFLPGLLEQPWMGMMRYLAPWVSLEKKADVSVKRCDSCAYGSPHLKSFRMMAVHMDISRLTRRCTRDHDHVIVEGKYTKASEKPSLQRSLRARSLEAGKMGILEGELEVEKEFWSYSGHLGQTKAVVNSSSRAAPRAAPQRERWILTDGGMPCQLPFWHEGHKYETCHPDGWCCLDPDCSRTSGCSKSSEMPLQRARDPVRSSCKLKALGQEFLWDPEGPSGDINLMFFLLQADAPGWEDQDLEPLVELSQSLEFRLVLMSYKSSSEEIQSLMLRTHEQLGRLATAGTAFNMERVRRSFVLATQPAWQISFDSCWLPSVTHAWSKHVSVLRAFSAKDDPIVLERTQTIRGDWALRASDKELSLPLRWAGYLCDENEKVQEEASWPAPLLDLTGAVALVARGTCSHYHKARAAKELGASGVVIFSQNEVPVAMSCAAPDPCKDGLDIPVVMTTRSVGETLLEEMFNSSSGSLVMASLASQSEGPNMVGVLGHSGGLWYNSPIGPSQLADELRGMEYRRQLLQRQEDLAKASSSEVLRVDVFQREPFPGGLAAKWTAQQAKLVREGGFTDLAIELRLECDDHLDDNCPPWDHELNLYLCLATASDEEEGRCHDRRTSLARWVTPYGREAHWFSEAKAGVALLSSEEAMDGLGTLHLHTWQHYTVSLVFWFRRSPDHALLPFRQIALWGASTPFDLGYNPSQRPRSFEVPLATRQVVLSALITGHGWGVDEENCAEFCEHSHHFAINGMGGPLLTKLHPTAGNEDGCKTQVLEGVVPNQYGTWPFGRAGWCPGQQVNWWEVDVTHWLQSETNTITYKALFNGTDYDPEPIQGDSLGFPAEIHVAAVLTFYTDDGSARKQPVNLLLEDSRRLVFP